MSCLYPKPAWVDDNASPKRIHFKLPLASKVLDTLPDGWRTVSIPCGKCWACLKTKSLDVTVRAVAESRMHDFSSFITLTVDDEHLPSVFPHGLDHRPWQLFAKRLRKSIGSFSFLMCGEYGSQTLRPHYHAILFGPKFVDDYVRDDYSYCPSRLLQSAWPYGNVVVSDANDNRMAYVSGYTLKDFQLGRDKEFFSSRGLGLPYVKWSRRPALGLRWFQNFSSDLIRDDGLSFLLNGKCFHFSGRYFLRRLQLTDPDAFAKIQSNRQVLDDRTCIMRHQDLVNRCLVQEYNQKHKKEEL